MLKVARKHDTNLAAIWLSTQVWMNLPAWYHPMMSTQVQCLLRRHKLFTVADLVKSVKRLQNQQRDNEHITSPACACHSCNKDRTDGCLNPHMCAKEALARIYELVPKYNPLQIGEHHNNLSLTKRHQARNIQARKSDDKNKFDPSITCKDNIAECFRIFTDTDHILTILAGQPFVQGLNLNPHKINVYTDRACWNNGKENARCGSRIWFSPEHQRNAVIQGPQPQTVQPSQQDSSCDRSSKLSSNILPTQDNHGLMLHDWWPD